MKPLPEPPVQLSQKALSELKTILKEDIGEKAVKKLSEAEINHLGCYFLTLAAIHLRTQMNEIEK